MKRFSVQLLFVFLLVGNTLFAQGPVRKYSNEFLSIGNGARALGMGNAHVTSVNDVTSGYWNPAGLLELESDLQIGLMHSEYFAGIANYDFGAIAAPIDSLSSFGVSMIRFGVDDIAYTIDLIDNDGNINYDKISTFSVADYAFLFSYARKLPIDGLSLGGNVKIIHRRAGDFAKAWGFGFDLGMKYNYKKWRFAAMARDVTSTYNAWSFDISDRMAEVWALTGNDIVKNSVEITLPKLILGASRTFPVYKKISGMAEFNADFTFDGKRNVLISGKPISIDPHAGLELNYQSVLFIRTGVMNIQKVKAEVGNYSTTTVQPNIGAGLKLKNFYLDYAFTDIGDQSTALYSHVFSVKIDINKKP